MHKTNVKGRGQGTSTTLTRTAPATAATSHENDVTNDDDDNWSNGRMSIKMENFNFLNRPSDDIVDDVDDDDDDDPNSIFKFDFRMSGHGDEILSDFAALLNDAESELLATAVDNYESYRNHSTSATTTTAAITTTTAVAAAAPPPPIPTAATANRIEPNSFTSELVATVCGPKPAEPIERLSQTSQSIGTIMSDHDYLSREDTLSILQSQENQLLLQILKEEEDKLVEEERLLAAIDLKAMEASATAAILSAPPSASSSNIVQITKSNNTTANCTLVYAVPTLIKSTVMGSTQSKPTVKIADAIASQPNECDAFNLQSILQNVAAEPLKSDEMAQLMAELRKHAIDFATKSRTEVACEAKPVQRPAAMCTDVVSTIAANDLTPVRSGQSNSKMEPSGNTSLIVNNHAERDAKNDTCMASDAMDTDSSFTFSRNHSEPLEYYGNVFDGSQLQSQDNQETGDTENQKETPLDSELDTFEKFFEKMLGEVKMMRSGARKAPNSKAINAEYTIDFVNACSTFCNITKKFADKLNVPLDDKANIELSKAHGIDSKKSITVTNDGASTSMETKPVGDKQTLTVQQPAKPENVETTAADNNSNESELEDSRALRANLIQKEKLLKTDSSGASLSASDYDESYPTRQRNKKKRKSMNKLRRSNVSDQYDNSSDSEAEMGQKKLTDTKLDDGAVIDNASSRKNSKSEFNVDDYYPSGSDDDEILIKNEPVIDSHRYTMEDSEEIETIHAGNSHNGGKLISNNLNKTNVDVDSPIVNVAPIVIDKSLNESIEYTPCAENGPFDNMDLDSDFYGFHENNNDDLPPVSLFEIGVKTEMLSQPIVNMEKERCHENDMTADPNKKNGTMDKNESATIAVPIILARDRKSLSTIDNIENFNELGDTLLADDEPDDCLLRHNALANPNLVKSNKEVLLANGIDTSKRSGEQNELSPKPNSSRRSSMQSSLGKIFEDDDDDIRSPFDTTGMNISSEDSDLSNLAKPTENHEGNVEKALVNGKQTESGDAADGESDENAREDIDDINDREIERLLDFSSLTAKRKANESNHLAKTNGTSVQTAKPNKRQKKDELLDILEQSNKTEDSDSGSDSADEQITEEQFLKERNLNIKQHLLQDTSSESDMDEIEDDNESQEKKQNGVHNSGDDDSDNSLNENYADSNSSDSMMEKFLHRNASQGESDRMAKKAQEMRNANEGINAIGKETIANEQNDLNSSLIDENDDEHGAAADDNKPKRINNKANNDQSTTGAEAVGRDKVAGDNDIDNDDETKPSSQKSNASGSSGNAGRRARPQIGKKVFGNLDKSLEIIMPEDSDKTDDEKSEASTAKRRSNKSSANNSDCEILDTSLFKDNKSKRMDDEQLSKLLSSSSNRTKQTATRAIPDDCISLSSDSDLEMEPFTKSSTAAGDDAADENAGDSGDEEKTKRTSRPMLRTDQLAGETKKAQKEETERVKRLEKKQEKLSQIIASQQIESEDINNDVSEVILDYDTKRKKSVYVHKDIVKHLKQHQVDGIKFMYDCCYGSVDSIERYPGSGCILAHCMGLGKTLQLIALLHTVISYPQLKTSKVLVICPKSTVMNWKDEIERWLSPVKNGRHLKLFHFPDNSDIKEKIKILLEWHQCGKKLSNAGCMLIGYEAYRTLVTYHNLKKSMQTFPQEELKRVEKSVKEYLLNPGSDLVICDEGHMIKNRKSATSLAVNQIKTKRRIILTGTPIQNNLKEYYSMVDFIKPSFLGTEKEFANLYANPIKSGQHKDSSNSEIKFMKERSFVLHKKLSKFVQRREAALLKTFLPDKFEFVLFIPMTDIQNRLYEYFLENNPLRDELGGKSLIPDYTILRKIWTHPKVLENAYLNAIKRKDKEQQAGALARANRKNNQDSEEEQPDDVLDSQTGKMAVTNDWWRTFVSKEDMECLLPSNKLKCLFEILNMCQQNGEKCLIFSAFVAVLDVVEFFMERIQEQHETRGAKKYPGMEHYRGPWRKHASYFRLDGKTAKSLRHQMITSFNDPKNTQTRVFLISAKAGGQGINLTGANRVVLLDTSWNPSNDQQNIFRVFRLGQKKICYIYRLLAMGTMEEKVYSRSVTKQAMSFRVVDEQQIDRHYNMAELTELYTLTKPSFTERPIPTRPKDEILAYLLHTYPKMAYKYHEHDSLLEQNTDEELSEAEKEAAWAAYENDVKIKNTFNMGAYGENFGMPNAYGFGLSPFSSMMSSYTSYTSSYLNQLGYPAAGLDMDPSEILRSMGTMYNNQYNLGLFGAGSAATNNIFTNPGLLSPPPPPVSSPSLMGLGQGLGSYGLASRALLGNQPSTSSMYNHASNYLTSAGQSSSLSGSKNSYNNLLNNQLMSSVYGYNNNYASMAGTSSNGATTTTASKPNSMYEQSMMQALNWFNGNQARPTNTPSPLGQQQSPSPSNQGPNAKRNPMLSKELSIPSLMPPRNPILEAPNIPSIPTSVIKSSTNMSGASTTIAPSVAHSPLVNTSSSNNTLRRRPSQAERAQSATTKNDKTSPVESPIIIKNVSSINKSAQSTPAASSPDANANKTPGEISAKSQLANNAPARSISNMGIVYPEKPTDDPTRAPTIKTNMGIVYPINKKDKASNSSGAKVTPAATQMFKTAQKQFHALNTKITSNATATTNTGTSSPVTTLTPVNKAVQHQDQKRASPMPQATANSMRGSPQLGNRPLNTSTSPITNKPNTLSALVHNKSLTITQTNKRLPQNHPVKQQINNNVTISPIGNAGASLNNSVQIMKAMGRSSVPSSAANLMKPMSKNNQNIPMITSKPIITKSPISQKSSPSPSKIVNAPPLSLSSLSPLSSTSTLSQARTGIHTKPGPQFTKTASGLVKQNQNQLIGMTRGLNQTINQIGAAAQMNSNVNAPRPIVGRRQTQTGQPPPLTTKIIPGVSPRTKPEVRIPLDKSQPVINRRASICTTGGPRSQQPIQLPQSQLHYPTRNDLNNRKRPGQPLNQQPHLSNFINSNEVSITAPKRQKTSDFFPAARLSKASPALEKNNPFQGVRVPLRGSQSASQSMQRSGLTINTTPIEIVDLD